MLSDGEILKKIYTQRNGIFTNYIWTNEDDDEYNEDEDDDDDDRVCVGSFCIFEQNKMKLLRKVWTEALVKSVSQFICLT